MSGDASKVPGSGSAGPRRLLTFRLDQERRQRLAARLAREGRTMSEVVIHGLRQYVHARHGDSPGSSSSPGLVHHRSSASSKLVLPDRVAARLLELRSTGRSELLSATLAALHEAGWPLRPLADALGISRQAVQARVRRWVPGMGPGIDTEVGPGMGTELRDHLTNFDPPPPFPHRRVASAAGLRPHLTIKIDHALRASAHRAAADEGHSLTQVIEAILDRYLRHGLAEPDQAPRARSARRSR